MCRGDGQFVQFGGNKTGGEGFGLNLMGLVAGSQYSLGVLFEVLLNMDQHHLEGDISQTTAGQLKKAQVKDLDECIMRIEQYLETTPKD